MRLKRLQKELAKAGSSGYLPKTNPDCANGHTLEGIGAGPAGRRERSTATTIPFPGGTGPAEPTPRPAPSANGAAPLRADGGTGLASRRHATSTWATTGPPERCRDAPASGRPQPPPPQARGGDAVQGLAPEGKPRGPRRRGVRGPDSSGESRSRLPHGGRPPRRGSH